MKNKQITIVDVAKAAGVSIATVSNVLNRRNVPLAGETILKVEAAAQRLGYRRNVMAASLSRKKTFELGLVLPGFGGYFADFAQAMQDTVHRCGYHLSVYSSLGQPELEKRHLETLLERRVDGLFCHGLALPPESTRKLVGEGTPLVLFNAWNWPEDVALGAINPDFMEGAAQAVEHLQQKGCNSMIYMGMKRGKATNEQRKIGFLQGIERVKAAGADICYDIVSSYAQQEEEAFDTIRQQLENGPVGLLAFDDHIALMILSRLQERGYRVPEQVRVVGINNLHFTRFCWPSITSLAIDVDNQVRHAVHLLLSHLDETAAMEAFPLQEHSAYRKEGSPAHELHIPMELIERMSTR